MNADGKGAISVRNLRLDGTRMNADERGWKREISARPRLSASGIYRLSEGPFRRFRINLGLEAADAMGGWQVNSQKAHGVIEHREQRIRSHFVRNLEGGQSQSVCRPGSRARSILPVVSGALEHTLIGFRLAA